MTTMRISGVGPPIGAAHALLLLGVAAVVCGPTWAWCIAAWRDPSYSNTGLWVCLLAAAGMVASLGLARERRLHWGWTAAAGLALLAHGFAFSLAPRMVAALLAAAALAAAWMAVSRGVELAGRWGLAAMVGLSLPLGTGSELYAGFPLRLLATRAAAFALGPQVSANGTALTNGVDTVFVDAPCAGVSMLTTSLMLAAAIAAVVRAGFGYTLLLLAAGGAVAIAGNIARAAALYLLETSSSEAAISHDTIGLAIFASGCALQLMLAMPLLRRMDTSSAPISAPRRPAAAPVAFAAIAVLLAGAVSSAATHLQVTRADAFAAPIVRDMAWPAAWHGRALAPKAPDPALQVFLQDFPGGMAEFGIVGSGESVLLRTVSGYTRKMHPPEICYRSFGWTCTPQPAHRDAEGRLWSSFEARRSDGSGVLVRQLYAAVPEGDLAESLDDALVSAETWPDAGSWFWAAALPGSEVAHTLAITHTLPLSGL